ncbi:8749_t:CDS:2 [Paraglomus brasilianum]|uniref:8749_t:CDS:1 n=1 Tax=Paraglomus brasilianum TaxID=144538 RepID=A0A9N9FCN6_9GLOM|nr:8749_t:CDS:2 [Paraglomus brasilianum]
MPLLSSPKEELKEDIRQIVAGGGHDQRELPIAEDLADQCTGQEICSQNLTHKRKRSSCSPCGLSHFDTDSKSDGGSLPHNVKTSGYSPVSANRLAEWASAAAILKCAWRRLPCQE